MERHSPWFQLVAVVLVVVGLFTLAAPAPAHAMDPQLMLAMASAAGAIALIVGYLIVANGREKQRAASLEGIYTCGDREASGPMGCGGPGSGQVRLRRLRDRGRAGEPHGDRGRRSLRAPTALAALESCPSGQASGPMGCGGPMSAGPGYSVGRAPRPPRSPSAVQGQ